GSAQRSARRGQPARCAADHRAARRLLRLSACRVPVRGRSRDSGVSARGSRRRPHAARRARARGDRGAAGRRTGRAADRPQRDGCANRGRCGVDRRSPRLRDQVELGLGAPGRAAFHPRL
ncbi:MAG: hypothetical protein AVDCRST_MAG65-2089, partial [uncultured Solirubrobacteraceae bacterium]